MTRWVAAVLGLVLVNVALTAVGRSVASEQDAVQGRLAALSRGADEARLVSEKRRGLEELVELAERRSPAGPLDIGPFREILFGAEQGFAIERLSLDFRPEQQVPGGYGGSKIHAGLRGSLDALFGYLERVESMHLPMVPEALTMRDDGATLNLAIRWSARWPLAGRNAPPELDSEEVTSLTRWLEKERTPNLGRDLFSMPHRLEQMQAPEPAEPVVHDVDEAGTPELAEQDGATPELTGFVLARPELESDASRRVLAAMRYEGAMQLLKVGDVVGGYVIARIDARESVTLTHSGTGEQIVLRLE